MRADTSGGGFAVLYCNLGCPGDVQPECADEAEGRRTTSCGVVAAFQLCGHQLPLCLFHSLPSLITTGIGYGVLFTVAISAHVLLMDRYAAAHHPQCFRRRNRWIGSAALVLGLLHALVFHPVDALTLAMATAFLGGGLLMAVFRDELPDARQARLPWLLAGCGGMGGLLLLQLLLHGH